MFLIYKSKGSVNIIDLRFIEKIRISPELISLCGTKQRYDIDVSLSEKDVEDLKEAILESKDDPSKTLDLNKWISKEKKGKWKKLGKNAYIQENEK